MSSVRSFLSHGLAKGLSITGYVIKWGLVGHVFAEYIGSIIICQGVSMEPTLKDGDIVLAEHITPRFGDGASRGDIVIVRSPTQPTEYICKRVVGVAGDKIPYRSRDSSVIHQVQDVMPWSSSYVPRGYIWVEGDNSGRSTDSRTYGAIPLGLVTGRVILRLLPPSRLVSSTKELFRTSTSGLSR